MHTIHTAHTTFLGSLPDSRGPTRALTAPELKRALTYVQRHLLVLIYQDVQYSLNL